jgi:hypothetical protein
MECDAKEGVETDSVLPAGKLLFVCNRAETVALSAALTAVSNTSAFDVAVSAYRIITYVAGERSRCALQVFKVYQTLGQLHRVFPSASCTEYSRHTCTCVSSQTDIQA